MSKTNFNLYNGPTFIYVLIYKLLLFRQNWVHAHQNFGFKIFAHQTLNLDINPSILHFLLYLPIKIVLE